MKRLSPLQSNSELRLPGAWRGEGASGPADRSLEPQRRALPRCCPRRQYTRSFPSSAALRRLPMWLLPVSSYAEGRKLKTQVLRKEWRGNCGGSLEAELRRKAIIQHLAAPYPHPQAHQAAFPLPLNAKGMRTGRQKKASGVDGGEGGPLGVPMRVRGEQKRQQAEAALRGGGTGPSSRQSRGGCPGVSWLGQRRTLRCREEGCGEPT